MLATNVKLTRPWPLKMILLACVATDVKLHGARPWPLKMILPVCCSDKRETPRRKLIYHNS